MGAKIIRKKKRLNLSGLASVMLVFSCVLSLCSSLFLRSYNNNLSIQMQKKKDQIAAYTVENDAIKVQIQTLSTKDRVIDIASDAGLTMNQNSIITIATGE